MSGSKPILIIFAVVLCSTLLLAQTAGVDQLKLSTEVSTDRLGSEHFASLNLIKAVAIRTGEDLERRWLRISLGSPSAGSDFQRPLIETNANEGIFALTLSGIDTAAYLGNRMLRDHGQYPIQFQVEFSDSQTVMISGKTLPFDDVQYYYSFDQEAYRLDFIFDDPNLFLTSDMREPRQSLDANSRNIHEPEELPTVGKGAATIKQKLIDAVIMAALILGAILLIFGVIVFVSKNKRDRQENTREFSDVLEEKSENNENIMVATSLEPLVLTAEAREEKIRELMRSDDISYDEAALRIQYETMNQVHE